MAPKTALFPKKESLVHAIAQDISRCVIDPFYYLNSCSTGLGEYFDQKVCGQRDNRPPPHYIGARGSDLPPLGGIPLDPQNRAFSRISRLQ
jgi:hypothetical protein